MAPSNEQLNKMIEKAKAQKAKAQAIVDAGTASEEELLEARETVIDMEAKILRLSGQLR